MKKNKKMKKVSGGSSAYWTADFRERNGSDVVNNLNVSKGAKVNGLKVIDNSTSSDKRDNSATKNVDEKDTNINWLHIG